MKIEEMKSKLETLENQYYDLQQDDENDNGDQMHSLEIEYFDVQLQYVWNLLKEMKIYDSAHASQRGSWYFETSLGKIRFANHSQLYDADINIGYTEINSNQTNDDGMNLTDATIYLTNKSAEYFSNND
jgi:hypothetical protein